MKSLVLKSNLLLLLAAIIWGFAFVAQRAGMEHVGPFTFNGVRFALGSISLLPLLYFGNNKKTGRGSKSGWDRQTLLVGLLAGTALFVAATFQQVGIVSTTAGKAGFITGLYVIFVPILGIFIKQKTNLNIWFGAIIAVVGLYFLSINENFGIEYGDRLVLVSAFFFALHILVIGRFSAKVNTIRLSIVQFATCSVLSLTSAGFTEHIVFSGIINAALPIFYGGVFSVGIAYTLQVVGQKHAHPSAASIILSLESLFAVVGGWLILSEKITARGLFGCCLMLGGMVLAQIRWNRK
ncbi:MAG: DMT family transporter [Bacteroidales bacterium]|nr:DMT family transporter [Bacteroidales bacterium]